LPSTVTPLRPLPVDETRARILMVDDRPANLVVLEAVLAPLGEELVRATSGTDALRKLCEGDFAVILMDVEMPVLDGIETASLIRNADPLRRIPIIFLTAVANDPSRIFAGYSHGAVDYLVKPFDPDILKAKVSIFVELWKKGELIKRQELLLRAQERRELERRSEVRFRAVTDSLPACVWVVRQDGIITYANHVWHEYAGRDAPSGLFDAVPADDVQGIRIAWKRMVETGAPLEREQRLRRRDGSYRWHLLRVVPDRDEHGAVGGWIAIGTDIDERKRLEEAQRSILDREQEARLQAELANRSKDEFLAAVSHELRTPLNAILGWSRTLVSGEAHDAQKITSALHIIERNTRAQMRLVDDLLDVSRIVAGKLHISPRPIDMGLLVENAVDAFRPAAESRGIDLAIRRAPRVTVDADPDRFRQIVCNLLANAMKFTPKGGKVNVDVRPVNGHAEIVVADTGVGISREFLPHVFDRFRQADGSLARSAGGLGLGLNIALHLVQLHAGTIEAESEGEQKGSRFIVRMPLSQADAEPLPWAEPQHVPRPRRDVLAGLRVLVVDDDDDTRQLTAEVLQSYAAEVGVAASVVSALDRIAERDFDVLLTDIGLPGDDGYALLRRVRALPGTAGIIAIALTAYATQQDSRRAADAGFYCHLSKPIDPLHLVRTLSELAYAKAERAPYRTTDVATIASASAP
jgi:PAS domain S-box-containing protein